jgi:hypothetical protein
MDMRRLIDIILIESMALSDARRVFTKMGIDPDLSGDALKNAYRKAAMSAHPDRGGDPERMKLINAAYDVLKSNDVMTSQASYGAYQKQQEQPKTVKPDFRNQEYVKQYFRDLAAGKSDAKTWWVANYDGWHQRGSFAVPCAPEDFPKLTEVMQIWDSHFPSKAVLISRGREVYVISVDGKPIRPIRLADHDSMNDNWSNDRHWMAALRDELDRIRLHQNVSSMMDL